jgi:hypothetical protein
MEIDFEFSIAKFKNNNKFEIEFEIKDIFNSNSDAGKLIKKLYLISHLYIAISVQKEDIYGDLSGSIINLIL